MAKRILFHRVTGGVDIEVSYAPITDLILLNVKRGNVMAACTIPPGKVRAAFDHPATFLPPVQASQIWPS